jgi:hypothetical protein
MKKVIFVLWISSILVTPALAQMHIGTGGQRGTAGGGVTTRELLRDTALMNAGGGGYGGNYLYGDVATTPLQGIDYGIAKIIRSVGEANLDNSQALINLTTAQRYEMENMKQWTETYFELRRMNREYRAAERGKRPTEADFIRYAQMGRPRRLTPSEIDTITGQIIWPAALQAAEFAPMRRELTNIFAQRASLGSIGLDNYLKADELTLSMLETLKRHIYDVPAEVYLRGRNFLESLAYEVRFPPI